MLRRILLDKSIFYQRHIPCCTLTCEIPGMKSPENVKPFRKIPGPLSLPIVGLMYKFLPYVGEFKFTRIHDFSWMMYRKYGKLVRLEMLPNINVVYAYDADDIETVMRHSGKFPERKSHSALEAYRHSRPEKYNNGGLLPTNGEKWWEIRSKFQKPLTSPNSAAKYIKISNVVLSEFVQTIKRDYIHDNPVGRNFMDYLARVNLQLLMIIAFDVKYDTFAQAEACPLSYSSKIIDCAEFSNSVILPMDSLPQFVINHRLKMYRDFEKSIAYLERVAEECIYKKLKNPSIYEDDKEPSLLESYLSDQNIDLNDIIGMCVDLLLAGIDTTTYASSFLYYHVARNQRVQDKLYEESVRLLPNADDIATTQVLSQASYVKAVIKESLRLNPISIGVGRLLTQDLVLSDYFVPKGTNVVTNNLVSSRLEEYFKNPNEFIPERWLKTDAEYTKPHPFVSIPFGHGSRMCIARRLAEQNMYITLLKIIRNFKLKWTGVEQLGIESVLINKPVQKIQLEFELRND